MLSGLSERQNRPEPRDPDNFEGLQGRIWLIRQKNVVLEAWQLNPNILTHNLGRPGFFRTYLADFGTFYSYILASF